MGTVFRSHLPNGANLAIISRNCPIPCRKNPASGACGGRLTAVRRACRGFGGSDAVRPAGRRTARAATIRRTRCVPSPGAKGRFPFVCGMRWRPSGRITAARAAAVRGWRAGRRRPGCPRRARPGSWSVFLWPSACRGSGSAPRRGARSRVIRGSCGTG